MASEGQDKATALLLSAKDPYQVARQLGEDRYLNLAVSAANWRRAFFVSSGAIFLSLLGLIYLGMQPKTVPYTVAVDRIGNVLAVGVPDNVYKIDPQRVLINQLQDWIQSARMVVLDTQYERRLMAAVYSKIAENSEAKVYMDAFYVANNPFTRLTKESVDVAGVTLLQETPTTWRMEWKETTRSMNGEIVKTETWKGLVSFERQMPKTAEEINKNPIGLWLKQVSWEKVQ